jgi:Mor family transcriptional regulator
MEEIEAERIIEEHNDNVRKKLMDEKIYDEFAEKSIEELLKKGKINIGTK